MGNFLPRRKGPIALKDLISPDSLSAMIKNQYWEFFHRILTRNSRLIKDSISNSSDVVNSFRNCDVVRRRYCERSPQRL